MDSDGDSTEKHNLSSQQGSENSLRIRRNRPNSIVRKPRYVYSDPPWLAEKLAFTIVRQVYHYVLFFFFLIYITMLDFPILQFICCVSCNSAYVKIWFWWFIAMINLYIYVLCYFRLQKDEVIDLTRKIKSTCRKGMFKEAEGFAYKLSIMINAGKIMWILLFLLFVS